MNNCKTCKHWQLKENRYNDIVFPYDPETHEKLSDDETVIRFGYRVRYCTHPKVLFYERPDINGAAVCDGSEYMAELLTAEEFGCVLHEEAS
jgi:hypothetical protein